jgi:hypothetical protein
VAENFGGGQPLVVSANCSFDTVDTRLPVHAGSDMLSPAEGTSGCRCLFTFQGVVSFDDDPYVRRTRYAYHGSVREVELVAGIRAACLQLACSQQASCRLMR